MKDVYKLALKVFEYSLTVLKPGVTFGSVYSNVYDFVAKEKQGHEDYLTKSLGHTIGLEFKDSNFLITSDNTKCHYIFTKYVYCI